MGTRFLNVSTSRLLLTSGFGAVCALAGLLRGAGADEKPQPKIPPRASYTNSPLMVDDAARKRYPFESLAGRLEYEVKGVAAKEPVTLTAAAKKRLAARDVIAENCLQGSLRRDALKRIHAKEAAEFVKREGVGMVRMRAPLMSDLALPVASIPFPPAPAQEPNLGPQVTLPKDTPTTATATAPSLPSTSRLDQVHLYLGFNFALGGVGLVKDRTHVAGFSSHQFYTMPILDLRPIGSREKATEHWQVRRLELVSLLKHAKPAVYVSENLPRMDELKSAPTRGLTTFEEKGLGSLRAGEDLAVDANVNRILMVGSLRANKACLDCHHGERGELLGAFSYVLQRDPPVKTAK